LPQDFITHLCNPVVFCSEGHSAVGLEKGRELVRKELLTCEKLSHGRASISKTFRLPCWGL